jgi:hypothetical protein
MRDGDRKVLLISEAAALRSHPHSFSSLYFLVLIYLGYDSHPDHGN